MSYIKNTKCLLFPETRLCSFRIDGYWRLQVWEKERSWRTVRCDDFTHYDVILVALRATLLTAQQFDSLIRWRPRRSGTWGKTKGHTLVGWPFECQSTAVGATVCSSGEAWRTRPGQPGHYRAA